MQILKIINVTGSNIYAILIGALWEADTKKGLKVEGLY